MEDGWFVDWVLGCEGRVCLFLMLLLLLLLLLLFLLLRVCDGKSES
jgi:hypothetical protein